MLKNPFMTDKDWENNWHPNFTRQENWGDPNKIYRELVIRLQTTRSMSGKPTRINCAFATTGHARNSKHYLGQAADIVIMGLPLSLQFFYAIRAGFRGIGVYPYWNTPGLHVDVRPLDDGHPIDMWFRDKNGLYESNMSTKTFTKIIRGDYDALK